LAFVELVKVLVNGLTSVVSDTSGKKRTANSWHLGNLLTEVFMKGENAFATALLSSFGKLLCIISYANQLANSQTGNSSSFLLRQKAYQYPFHASVIQIPMMVVTNLNQAFCVL
jgi:hypothetical protein